MDVKPQYSEYKVQHIMWRFPHTMTAGVNGVSMHPVPVMHKARCSEYPNSRLSTAAYESNQSQLSI